METLPRGDTKEETIDVGDLCLRIMAGTQEALLLDILSRQPIIMTEFDVWEAPFIVDGTH